MHQQVSVVMVLAGLLAALSLSIPAGADEDIERSGGDGVLLEEVTATWCEFCAMIDDDISQLQVVHGSRLTLLTIHPKGGPEPDPLYNEAMGLREARLNSSQSDGTPAFWLDAEFYGQGVIDVNSLSKDILGRESQTSSASDLTISTSPTDDGEIEVLVSLDSAEQSRNNTRITIMMVAKEVKLNKGAASNGQTLFHNVLLSSISIDLDDIDAAFPQSAGTGWSIKPLQVDGSLLSIEVSNDELPDEEVFFVAIHELDAQSFNESGDSRPLGIIDSQQHEVASTSGEGIWQWLVGGALLVGILLILPARNKT